MSKKDFSVALKYVEARPRSQRRKGAEARVSSISVGGSGVSATDLSLLQANLISVTNNFTALKDLFDSMFEKDSDGNIHAKLSLWSSGGITAGGAGSSGSGGGGISYNRLDSWADYSADKAGYVLSAALGKDLDNRVSALANAGYVTQSALAPYALRSEIPSLAGYATRSWVGENYLSKNGGKIIGKGDYAWVQLRLSGDIATIMFEQYEVEKGCIGWMGNTGIRLQNSNEYGLAVTDSNDPIFYWGQNGSVQRILLHAGNYADYITNSYLKSTLGISDWALAATKPTYTASEVGALSVNGGDIGGSLNFRNGSSITCANGIVLEMYAGVDTYLRGSSNIYISAPNVYTQRNVYTYKVLDSGNYSDYALPKTGGTVNGSITATASLTTPVINTNTLKVGNITLVEENGALKVIGGLVATGGVTSGEKAS